MESLKGLSQTNKNPDISNLPESYQQGIKSSGFFQIPTGKELEKLPKKEEIKQLVEKYNKSESGKLMAGFLNPVKTPTGEEQKIILPFLKNIVGKIKGLFTKTAENTEAKNVVSSILKTTENIPKNELPKLELDPVKKVIEALNKADIVRGKQEVIYSLERSSKVAKGLSIASKTAGEKGFYSELGALKGESPKLQFTAIRDALGETKEARQSLIDGLFDKIKNDNKLNFFESINARKGLMKMLNGSIPTESELGLLENVFGRELTDAILSKRTFWQKATEGAYEVANIPRSLMSSFDLSAPFRQGAFFIGRPKQFIPAFVDMFKSFGSEKAFNVLQESISNRKSFELMKEAGLSLTDVGTSLLKREERFMSNLAEKIPLVGKGVRASSRAYTGFLNKLRADVFDDLLQKATQEGLNPQKNPELLKGIANFINTATGRGDKLFGAVDITKSAKILNSIFFSPRLMASRTTLLNPIYYIKLDSFVRKEALKSLFSFAGIAGTILTLAKAGGAEVGSDPRSSDFGKIKIGNTRLDMFAGFQQYIRMVAQLISGQYINSKTGKVMTLGEGYKPLTRKDIVLRQIESKEAPIISFATTLLAQQDWTGQPVNVANEIKNRFIPMVIQDTIDLAKDNPKLLPIELLAALGVGIQTYSNTNNKKVIKPPSVNNIKTMPSLKGLSK